MAIKYLSINNETLDISNIPKLDSNNTFTGNNTFNNLNTFQNISLTKDYKYGYVYLNGIDNKTTPSETQTWFLVATNNNSSLPENNPAYISLSLDKTNNAVCEFAVRKTLDHYDYSAASLLGIQYNYNASRFETFSPHPPLQENSNFIATTYWVRQLMRSAGINV